MRDLRPPGGAAPDRGPGSIPTDAPGSAPGRPRGSRLGRMALAWGLLLAPGAAQAACNAIPQTPATFRGAIGTVNRPFARGGESPGDLVQAGRGCGSPALADHDGDGSIDAGDYLVTVVFTPPEGGPRNVVVLTAASDCSGLVCSGSTEKPYCVAGAQAGIVVSTQSETVGFLFPDTDDHPSAPAGDGRPLSGPATIAVSPAGAAVPCELKTQRCADYGGSTSLFACVDELYRTDGQCGTDRADLDPTFGHFTALPPANVYARLCDDADGATPGCDDQAQELRFAVDQAGNAAVPVRWTEILRDKPKGAGKDNRKVQGSTAVPARSGGSTPIDVPGDAFLASFTPFGTGFSPAPVFEPRLLPATPPRPLELKLSGEADEPESTLWFARRKLWAHQCGATGPSPGEACEPGSSQDCPGTDSCEERATPAYFACTGGFRDGLPCTRGAHCPQGACTAGSVCVQGGTPVTPQKSCLTDLDCDAGAECGRGLFEFRGRMLGGVGPVVVPKQASPGPGRVCRGGPDDGMPCTSTCTCVGFRASAHGYNPKP